MPVVYYEDDADSNVLAEKRVVLFGYGQQGRLAGLNMRDNGVRLLVSGTPGDITEARSDGFITADPTVAAKEADVLIFMLPDEKTTDFYMQYVSPHLKRGNVLIFGSAYNVAFGFVEPPPFVDVGVVAPRTAGGIPWKSRLSGDGFPSFVAVGQDASTHAWEVTLAVALVMGVLRSGAVEVSVEQEAEISLFIQQAVMPLFYQIIVSAARLLSEEGYPPEAIFTDLYLSGKFSNYFESITRSGVIPALETMSRTAQYGTLSRLDRFKELKLSRLMEVTLEEIRDGNFAREWSQEYNVGQQRLDKLLKAQKSMDMWELEQQTLDMLQQEPDDFL